MSGYWTMAKTPDLTSRVAIVTGAKDGPGSETPIGIAKAGWVIVTACRNRTKAEATWGELGPQT